MPRSRTRKTDHGMASEAAMGAAVKLVISGTSIRIAAEKSGVTKSSLQRYVQKYKKAPSTEKESCEFTPNYSARKVFSSQEEDSLKSYVIKCSSMNYGLTRRKVRILAFEFALKNNKIMPDNWMSNKSAGEDWMYGFMKRHQLSLRQPESCSLGRSIAFNKHNIALFYSKLKEVYSRFSVFSDGSRVYNLDETSTTTVHKPQKIVTQRGIRQISQVTSAERGTLVTTCCIINAHGHCLPPAMVFPRVHFKFFMINDAPAGTLGLPTTSGWMNSELFLEVMKHFIKHTSASKDNPALLILDNHESHLSIAVLDIAKDNGVTILTLHPHCSHKIQPLDVSVYGPFKTYYSAAMESILLEKPGQPITIYDIAKIVNTAHQRAMTPSNIISGFRKTGTFPFDEHVFADSDFAPSIATDRPNPEIHQEEIMNVEGAGQPISDNGEPLFRSPQDIRGYPAAQPRKSVTHQQKKRRSMIATDTPEKDELTASSNRAGPSKTARTNNCQAKRRIITEEVALASSSDEDELVLSDHSSDEIDEDILTGRRYKGFLPLENEPVIDNYVLVEFNTEPKTYYVGIIIGEKDMEDEFEISYLKRRLKSVQFVFPELNDIASVKLDDIKMILNNPIRCGTTKRQNSNLKFDYNFDNILVK